LKKAIVVASTAAPYQQTIGDAFAKGLRKHGWGVAISPTYQEADLVIFWGVRKQEAINAQRSHGEVCILERGYVGDRFQWTSVSFGGGLNGRAEFRGVRDDPSRWEKYFAAAMRPWRASGGYGLIMGQVLTDMSLRGLEPMKIWADAADSLRSKGMEVFFRPHPKAQNVKLPGVPLIGGDLSKALEGAASVVTINSNSAVDAVLAGVPSVALDEGSMAWPVTAHEAGEIATPDREAWAHRLAWKQWRLPEMASGECWEAICPG
jgi:hypothetical protein